MSFIHVKNHRDAIRVFGNYRFFVVLQGKAIGHVKGKAHFGVYKTVAFDKAICIATAIGQAVHQLHIIHGVVIGGGILYLRGFVGGAGNAAGVDGCDAKNWFKPLPLPRFSYASLRASCCKNPAMARGSYPLRQVTNAKAVGFILL